MLQAGAIEDGQAGAMEYEMPRPLGASQQKKWQEQEWLVGATCNLLPFSPWTLLGGSQ